MIYGFIISAGKQTRFMDSTPKCLMPINGEPMLDINIRNMKLVCDEVYVVCSRENEHLFDSNYKKIIISSGHGCGDAVLRAFLLKFMYSTLSPEDTCFIQWGDCFHEESIYTSIIDNYKGKWLIPCVYETIPYVQIVPDGKSVKVLFSKYNENVSSGYHDLSIFYGNIKEMLDSLQILRSKLWDWKTSSYKHKHGNEMTFLDVFNETDINADILLIENYKSKDFNTLEEYTELVNSL